MKKSSFALSIALAAAALFSVAGAAHAAPDLGALGFSAGVGSTGVGAHVSYPIKPNLNARVGMNYLNYTYSGSSSQADYDFKMKLQTFDVLADYFPMDNGFRLTGGLVYNGNKIDVSVKSNDTSAYVLNGNTYSAAQAGAINGSIDFGKVAPYLGVGWGNAAAVKKGWGFTADLGVMFQGSPKSSLSNSGCTAPSAFCDQLAADVAAEKGNLDSKLSNLNSYPVVRIGASYRF